MNYIIINPLPSSHFFLKKINLIDLIDLIPLNTRFTPSPWLDFDINNFSYLCPNFDGVVEKNL